MRSALVRAQISLRFMSRPAPFVDRPRPASRPRAEADRAELSERGLGRRAARGRRRRLPRAGEPVHGAGRTGLDLWRGRGGEIRGRSLGPGEERRVFAEVGEAVDPLRCHRPRRRVTRTPRPLNSITAVSGILDHPPPRVTTAVIGAAVRPLSTAETPTPSASPETAPARRSTASSPRPATSRAGRARRCRPASR